MFSLYLISMPCVCICHVKIKVKSVFFVQGQKGYSGLDGKGGVMRG